MKQRRLDEEIAAIKKEQRDKKLAVIRRHLILNRRYNEENKNDNETEQHQQEMDALTHSFRHPPDTPKSGVKLKSVVGKMSLSRRMMDPLADVETGEHAGNHNVHHSVDRTVFNPFGGSKNILSPAGIRQMKSSMGNDVDPAPNRTNTRGSSTGSRGKPSMQDLPISSGDNILRA